LIGGEINIIRIRIMAYNLLRDLISNLFSKINLSKLQAYQTALAIRIRI